MLFTSHIPRDRTVNLASKEVLGPLETWWVGGGGVRVESEEEVRERKVVGVKAMEKS